MADELQNKTTVNNNDQTLNLADRLKSSNPPMPPSIGGFDVSIKPTPEPATPELRKPTAPGEIPAVRTLRGDIQEYTQKTKSSYFDILAASQKKRPALVTEWTLSSPKLRIALIAVGIITILLIFIGGYFLFIKQPASPAPVAARPATSLIYADNEHVLEFTGDTKLFAADIQNALTKAQLSNEFTYLPAKTTTAGTEKFLGLADFFQAAGVSLPAEVSAAITTPFTFGAIDTFGENETVLLFKVTEYDRTMAALLNWEKTMPRNLDKLLPSGVNRDFGALKFKDVVVKNQDARILSNLEGRPILAYTIFNRKVVVITSSKTALEAALDKLIASPPNL